MEKKTKKKFTAAQQFIIDHLNDGWELGVATDHCTSTPRTRYVLQQGKMGAGGKTQKVTATSVRALREMGAIKRVERKPFPWDAIYELDRAGLAALGHS